MQLDFERLEQKAEREWQLEYGAAKPFPNIVIDDFISRDLARRLYAEYDKIDWQSYRHFNEDKQGSNAADKFPPLLAEVMRELNSPRFLKLLENVTGIGGLIADRDFGSGGIHQSKRGGFLNIHADFTVHPYHKDWHRRLNLLVYLTDGWLPEWGGELELWSTDMKRCERKIAPRAARCVIFSTDKDSFHGHPEPMQCPEGVFRRSIALYYYTKDRADAIATNYQPRPQDSIGKRALIFADRLAVSAFHKTKSLFGVRDGAVTGIMSRIAPPARKSRI